MHFHAEGDEYHRQGTRGSAFGHAASKGSTLRGVRLRHLSQAHSGEDGADGGGSEAGASAFRLRGRGEALSQQARFTAMMGTFGAAKAFAHQSHGAERVSSPLPTS